MATYKSFRFNQVNTGWGSDIGHTTTIFGQFSYDTMKSLKKVVCIELCENLDRDINICKQIDGFQMIQMRADKKLQEEIRAMADHDRQWQRPEFIFQGNRLSVDHAFAYMGSSD